MLQDEVIHLNSAYFEGDGTKIDCHL